MSSPFSAFSRRNFLRTSVLAGTAASIVRTKAQTDAERLEVAVIGCGAQGTALVNAINSNPNTEAGVNLRAFCDIDSRAARKLAATAQSRGNTGDTYDRADDMFSEIGDNLDCVLVATPDYVHHTYAIMAMEAGCDVYCEKMMSNRIATARDIVLAAQQNNSRLNRPRICQIGHQRRSNPRYLAVKNELIDDLDIFGQFCGVYAQWNRDVTSSFLTEAPSGRLRRGYPSDDVLRENGYIGGRLDGTKRDYTPIEHYLNWRTFKAYGAGPVSDLGAHQIDLFPWFLNALPKRISAQGGSCFFNNAETGYYQLADTGQILYEFETDQGQANCIYQVMTTNNSQGSHERWQGVAGTLLMGEDPSWNNAYLSTSLNTEDGRYDQWDRSQQVDQAIERDLLGKQNEVWRKSWEGVRDWEAPRRPWDVQGEGALLDARASAQPGTYDLLTNFQTAPHEPHLRNFFDAVRSGNKEDLNCPPEQGFITTVMVLKFYEALANGGSVDFTPEDFVASPGPIDEPGVLSTPSASQRMEAEAAADREQQQAEAEAQQAQAEAEQERQAAEQAAQERDQGQQPSQPTPEPAPEPAPTSPEAIPENAPEPATPSNTPDPTPNRPAQPATPATPAETNTPINNS